MTYDQMLPGTRVRLVRRVGGCFPGAMYDIAPGPVGTVVEVEAIDYNGEDGMIVAVRFDDRIADLDDWDNTLWVEAEGDATAADFEVVS